MSEYIVEGVAFIENALEGPSAFGGGAHGRNRVFVHCMAGVSRSATVVTAYLAEITVLPHVFTLARAWRCCISAIR